MISNRQNESTEQAQIQLRARLIDTATEANSDVTYLSPALHTSATQISR